MANTENKGVIYYLEQILNAIYAMSGQTVPSEAEEKNEDD